MNQRRRLGMLLLSGLLIACLPMGFSRAAGSDARAAGQPLVLTSEATRGSSQLAWGKPVTIIAPRSSTPNRGYITDVSCATRRFCMAVDDAGFTATYSRGVWHKPVRVAQQAAKVSCAGKSFCAVLAGNRVYFRTAHGFSRMPKPSLPRGAALRALSCAGPRHCVALDEDGDVFTFEHGTWTTASSVVPAEEFPDVSCPTTTFCMASFVGGQVSFLHGTKWGPSRTVLSGQPSFTWGGCSARHLCAVAAFGGHHARGRIHRQGHWIPERKIFTTVHGVGPRVHEVSCASKDLCVAVANAGAITSNGHGTWTRVHRISSGFIEAVSCPTDRFCVAVDGSGHAVALK
jgi:hypothetical protein